LRTAGIATAKHVPAISARMRTSMEKIKTHYDNLQVTENASPEVIRGAYRYLSQKWHPDRNPRALEQATRITQIINEAFAVLSDPHRRREHDAWIRDQRAAQAAQAAKERVAPKQASEGPAQSAPATPPPRRTGLYKVTWSGAIWILAASFGIGIIVAIGYSARKERGRPAVARPSLSVASEPDATAVEPAASSVEAAAPAVGAGEPQSSPQSAVVYPLTVVNQCSESLRFAMAYRGTDGQMHVAGWASLVPRETGHVQGLIAAPGVFLYAESDSAQFTWNGNDHPDALTAMVSTANFNYDLARMASLEVAGFHPVRFFAITMQKDGGEFDFQCN